MLSQNDAEGDLIQVYRSLLAVIVLMMLLAVVAYRYFGSLDTLSSQNVVIEQNRLTNLVLMVRSQWLREGKGDRLMLDWEHAHEQTQAMPVIVKINQDGWPQPPSLTESGCSILWLQLLGYQWLGTVSFNAMQSHCEYVTKDGDTIVYQINSGNVVMIGVDN